MPRPALLAYALFGMPLAMAALPLYVHLPQFYAGELGVPLTQLGILLLALRLVDAVVDPLLGLWSDSGRSRKRLIVAAAPMLAIGMIALFRPPALTTPGLLAWLAMTLLFVYTAFSLATINLGAWGAELSDDPVERTRITATREGLALVGVVCASIAPSLLGGSGPRSEGLGLQRFAPVFALFLGLCTWVLWRFAPDTARAATVAVPWPSRFGKVLRDVMFRRLLVVFMFNGIAAAIPATLLLFFIADVLIAPERQALFLVLYFVAGACGMPLWVRASARWGKVRAWQLGMVASVIAFVWAAALTHGDVLPFAIVCVLSGLALGADLALPPSLLADVISRGDRNRGADNATGAYFGVWTLATKLNLALAAGVALPLVAALGYVPATRDHVGLTALAFVYAGVPSILKLAAAVALVHFDRLWRNPG
jgi:Na+/melibiose symporter-like transporter